MGAEQSATGPQQLRSQRDEDIPYTSYSISKPIDGDMLKSSPRLTRGKAAAAAKELLPRVPNAAAAAMEAAVRHDIVVVAEGRMSRRPDAELQQLEAIPVFLPILRNSLNLPTSHDSEALDRLDSRQVLQLCTRYQEHLRQCAEAVAFDQNALCVRIKEIDFTISTIYNSLTERQRRFAKYAEQIQKIQEMHTVLSRVRMTVEQTIPLMERLNSVLPPEDQLEPFSMNPARAASTAASSSPNSS